MGLEDLTQSTEREMVPFRSTEEAGGLRNPVEEGVIATFREAGEAAPAAPEPQTPTLKRSAYRRSIT